MKTITGTLVVISIVFLFLFTALAITHPFNYRYDDVPTPQSSPLGVDDVHLPVEKGHDLAYVNVNHSMYLNLTDFREAALYGKNVTWDIAGTNVTFTLIATPGSNGQDDGTLFESLTVENASEVNGIITSSYAWFTVKSADAHTVWYIRPYDGTGASGYYAVFTDDDYTFHPIFVDQMY
ncbi:MAG: hypothetical protein SA339_05545 [Methanomassiliicoccus sp.]|nr:hypothetical protein [Methanomassiliicoccus sp.]